MSPASSTVISERIPPQLPDRNDFKFLHRPLLNWVGVSLFVIALVLLTYRLVDQPAAFLAHDLVRPGGPLRPLFTLLTRLPDLLTTISVLLILLLPVLVLCRGFLSRLIGLRSIILISSSFVFASAIKTLLKWAFGRTWPETWIYNNPSLAHDGVFGFFPFHGGAGWSSFPSGHMTAVVSIVAMAWHIWPRLAPIWCMICAGAATGLVVLNLHFVSDVIAGAYVGCASAFAVLWLSKRQNMLNHQHAD